MLTMIRFLIGYFVEIKTKGDKPLIFEQFLYWLLLDVSIEISSFILAVVLLIDAFR